jgi:hypothetical protein
MKSLKLFFVPRAVFTTLHFHHNFWTGSIKARLHYGENGTKLVHFKNRNKYLAFVKPAILVRFLPLWNITLDWKGLPGTKILAFWHICKWQWHWSVVKTVPVTYLDFFWRRLMLTFFVSWTISYENRQKC